MNRNNRSTKELRIQLEIKILLGHQEQEKGRIIK